VEIYIYIYMCVCDVMLFRCVMFPQIQNGKTMIIID
jgi:hypothetical protein